jgi:hypothetical protein
MFTYLDNRFAHCLTHLFQCADVCLRHAANQAVALRVKSQPGAFAALTKLLEAPDFRSKLLHARQNPKGAVAQEILSVVVAFVNAAAVKVPWGHRERSAEVHALIAGQRAHGAAAIFYTCAPDDVHQANAVRLSFPNQGPEERHDDTLFPRGQQKEFLAALRGQTTEERTAFEPRMDEISLQKLAAANPIASVLTFAHLTESFRTDLLGHSWDRPSNLSMLMPPTSLTPQEDGVAESEHKRMRGVFGVCTCNRDVKECNKRAAMHEHGQAHSAGVSPELLAHVASNDALRQEALDALDTQVRGEIELEFHAIKVLQEELRVAARRDAAFEIVEPRLTREEAINEHCRNQRKSRSDLTAKEEDAIWCEWLAENWDPEVMVQSQIVIMNRHTHEHQATCAGAGKDGKGKGRWMCRMCAPWGHDVERTRCVELRAFVPDETPVDDVDMDVEVAASDGVVVCFYLHHDEEEARRKKAGLNLDHDAQMEAAEMEDTEIEDAEMEDADWPKHLKRKHYRRFPLDGIPCGASRATLRRELRRRLNIELDRATLFHVVGGAEVETTLELALEGNELPPGRVVHVEVRQPIEYRCSYCYPHNLLGKTDVTQEEREDEIRKEDNLRDLYYYAYRPTPAKAHSTDQRSLVVDIRRRLLPTKDDMEYKGEKNELAALVDKVRHNELTEWDKKPIDEAIKKMELIDASGQRLYELLQRPEFRVHRERLDEAKQDAQHVSTCRKRIFGRLAELCERGGVDKATVDELDQTPLVGTLCGRLRGLLSPEDCDYVGLDEDDVKRAVKLEAGTDGRPGLRLRRLLDAWGSRAFVCRNGIIADWNITIAVCTAGNAVPLTLGAGSASKSTAMYSIKYMGKDSVNISAAATVLHEADKKVREYPSSADDKLTAERTSKHFCQHVINHRCGWHLSVLS